MTGDWLDREQGGELTLRKEPFWWFPVMGSGGYISRLRLDSLLRTGKVTLDWISGLGQQSNHLGVSQEGDSFVLLEGMPKGSQLLQGTHVENFRSEEKHRRPTGEFLCQPNLSCDQLLSSKKPSWWPVHPVLRIDPPRPGVYSTIKPKRQIWLP